MTSDVDVCVLCHNRSDCTLSFLGNLARVTKGIRYKLWVLDNGSTDSTQTVLAWFKQNTRWWWPWARHRGIRYEHFRQPVNRGFSAGNNILAKKGAAKWLLFLNNDTFPDDPDWLKKLVAFAEESNYAAVGPTSNNVLGLQGEKYNVRGWPSTHGAKFLSGFCVLVRRDLFERIGGWDEQFMNGDEDLDLSIRLREFGDLGINRQVYVEHACSQSLAPWCESQGKTIQQHFKGTREQLINKHGLHWERDLFFWADLKTDRSKWREMGILANGQFWHTPGTEADTGRKAGELHSSGIRRSGKGSQSAGKLHSGTHRAHTGHHRDGYHVTAASRGCGCPFDGDRAVTCGSCEAQSKTKEEACA